VLEGARLHRGPERRQEVVQEGALLGQPAGEAQESLLVRGAGSPGIDFMPLDFRPKKFSEIFLPLNFGHIFYH
jgi:hypothetical protein